MRISDWSSDVCSSDLPRDFSPVALLRPFPAILEDRMDNPVARPNSEPVDRTAIQLENRPHLPTRDYRRQGMRNGAFHEAFDAAVRCAQNAAERDKRVSTPSGNTTRRAGKQQQPGVSDKK